jgi:hypothetical protein
LEVPEDRSPVFVRLGSVIPLTVENDVLGHGRTVSRGWRTLDVYPSTEPSQAALWDAQGFPPVAGRDRTRVALKPGGRGLEVHLEGGPRRDTTSCAYCGPGPPEPSKSMVRSWISGPPGRIAKGPARGGSTLPRTGACGSAWLGCTCRQCG